MDFVMKKLSIPITATLAISAGIISTPTISLSQEKRINDVIIVTANRRPQPLSQVGSSVSVITGDDLERNQQSFVLDALETVPGVSISQNGAFGGTASVSIRGAGTNNTVLMVDGIQLNDASAPGGAFNFSSLDTYNIERIEILRGPQSVLYGSDATGGVINIITKTGGEGLGGKIFVEGGSFNTQRAGANIYGGDDRYGFNVSASGINTDGISAADENDGNTERDGLRNYTFSGKFTGKLSENFSIEALSSYSDSHSLFDSFGPVDGTMVHTVDTDQYFGAVRGTLNFLDDRFVNTFSAEYAAIDRFFISDFDPFLAEGRRTNLDYLGVYTINSDWTVTAGLQHEKVKSIGASDASFDINSVFGEAGFTGVEGLTLTAGGRYDDHETFGGEATFRVTGSYEFEGIGTRLIANAGEGFKAPSISQLTFLCLTCDGLDEDLKPERSFGYEFGIEQSIMDDRLVLSATYFYIKIEDKITFISFADGYDNIESTDSKGVELSIDANITNTLSVTGSYTYTSARNRMTGDRLRREPRSVLSASLNWMPTDKLSTSINVVHNGEELINDGDLTNPLKSWTRIDIRASYELLDGLSLYGRVDNLFNEEYQHVLGYGTPDRSYFAGLRKTF